MKTKPYDKKLSKNVALATIGFFNKIVPWKKLTKKEEAKLKKEIMEFVDRKIVLYKDYEEDIQKSVKQFSKMIDEEKSNVRFFCIGLAHPSPNEQEKFTRWLQDTVIFHLTNLQRRLK